jgi:hypothetical protein
LARGTASSRQGRLRPGVHGSPSCHPVSSGARQRQSDEIRLPPRSSRQTGPRRLDLDVGRACSWCQEHRDRRWPHLCDPQPLSGAQHSPGRASNRHGLCRRNVRKAFSSRPGRSYGNSPVINHQTMIIRLVTGCLHRVRALTACLSQHPPEATPELVSASLSPLTSSVATDSCVAGILPAAADDRQKCVVVSLFCRARDQRRLGVGAAGAASTAALSLQGGRRARSRPTRPR